MEEYSRSFDVGVTVGLAATLIVFSTAILLTYRLTGRDENSNIPAAWLYATFALLFAATIGLAAGRFLPLALSVSMMLCCTTGSLLTAYIGIVRMFDARRSLWTIIGFVSFIIVFQVSIISLWQRIELVFLTSSLANGALCLLFVLRINAVLRREGFDAGLFLTLPFAAISAAYFLRLGLLAAGVAKGVIVIASVGIAFVLSFASVLWVFGALVVQLFRLKQQVEWAANHDPLTKLPNRTALDAFLEKRAADQAQRQFSDDVCLYVDLDHFKRTNDTHGHAAGDAALIASATRLLIAAESVSARVFRVGGDEFTVFLRLQDCRNVRKFAESLRRALCEPISYKDNVLRIGASIGFAGTGDFANTPDIMHAADKALYAAKNDGRGRVVGYDQRLDAADNGQSTRAAQ